MAYQPNRLVLEAGQRLVVDQFSRSADMRLALRPARKRLFAAEPNIASLQVELNKPAFAVLMSADDPDGKPLLVFETDPVSAGIRDLYRNADIPYIEADQVGGRGMLRFERPGFSAKLQFDDRGDTAAVEAVLRWAETSSQEFRGALIRNAVERTIAEALGSCSDELGISVHHQVPFGYAAGYRQDLPRSIARHTIEMAVSMKPSVSPGAPVVMPIRVESISDDDREADSIERDECVADFVISVGMPMVAVQPADEGRFRATYSLEDMGDTVLDAEDKDGWQSAMRNFASHAISATQEGMELAV